MQWYTTIAFKTKTLAKVCSLSQSIRTVVKLSFRIVHGPNNHENPPILILHDLLSSKKHWEGIAKTIVTMTEKTAVTVDLRNHGDSPHSSHHNCVKMSSDILSLMDKLTIKRGIIMGMGMGGLAAMYTALTEPKKVAGLVIMDVSPISVSRHVITYYPKVMEAMKNFDFTKFKKVRQAIASARKHLQMVVNDDVMLTDLLQQISVKKDEIVWKCNLETLNKNFVDLITFPTPENKQYIGPVLFIGGQKSDILPPDDLPEIRRMFPQAVITYLPGCGHKMYIDDPKTFIEFTLVFIRSIEIRK